MDQEFKLLITGDASGAISATQQASAALRKLKVDTSDLSDETKRSLGLMPLRQDDVDGSRQRTKGNGPLHGESSRFLSEIGERAATGAGGGRGELSGGLVGLAVAFANALETVQGKIGTVMAAADRLDEVLTRLDADRGRGVRNRREPAAGADGMESGKRLPEFAGESPRQTGSDGCRGGRVANSEAEAELTNPRQQLRNGWKENDQLGADLPLSGVVKPSAAVATAAGQDSAGADPGWGDLTQVRAAGNGQGAVQTIIDVINTQGAKTNDALNQLADAIGVCGRQELAIVERIVIGQMAMQQTWSGVEQRLQTVEARLAAMTQHQY